MTELETLRERVKELETKYSYAIEKIHAVGVTLDLHTRHPTIKIDAKDVFRVEEELKKIYNGPTNPSRFLLSPEAEANADIFCAKHNQLHKNQYQGAIGGSLTFTFTNTSIGQIQNVECYCGEKECINGDEL